MKKLLLITLAIVTLINMGYSQNIIADSKNDWEKEGLKGKVKSKIRESYTQDSIGGPVISQQEEARYNELGRHTYDSFDFGSYFYKYDDMGRIIEKNYYNSYGRLSSNLTFKYNERSNSFEMSGIEDKMFKSLTTTFDARGKKTQEKSYTGPLEKIIWTVSRYDDKSNKIEQSKYKADGSLEYKETYQYDDKSNKIEQSKYKADGSLEYKETYQYDDKSRLIEQNKYDNNGNLLESSISRHKDLAYNKVQQIYRENGEIDKIKSEYKLNKNGDVVEINTTGERIEKETYKYNDKGKLIEHNAFGKYGILLQATYQYNDNDELIETIIADNRGVERIEKETYKYDDKGNKIELEKTYTRKGKIVSNLNFIYLYENSDEDKTSKVGMVEKKLRLIDLFKYDAQGNLIEEASFNADGTLKARDTYKYDAQGNRIEEASYNADSSLEYKETYQYDDKSNKIEQSKYEADGSLEYKGTYKYDAKSNKIEQSKYKADGSLEYKETYQYDDKSNKMKVRKYSGGSLDYEEINKYDIKGRIIERRKYVEIVLVDEVIDGKGVIVEEIGAINWVYDEEGNCVEEIRSGDYAFSHKVYKVIVKYEYYRE